MATPPADLARGPETTRLFQEIESRLKNTSLGDERWYLLAIACLVAGPDPEAAAALYLYLTSKPQYQSSPARQALVRRLREALVKSISIVGVCKPIEAVVAISRVERPEDRDLSCSRAGWQADEASHERGINWLGRLYARNTDNTLALFDSHKDFAWISTEITYGLYLSDRQVLDDTDTQLVVLPGIMSQNLRHETHWHIRGTRRIGVSKEDVQVIWDAVQAVAAFFDVRLNKVPTVDDVEPDV